MVTAVLVNDTGSSSTDTLTRDATIRGTVTDSNGVASLRTALDGRSDFRNVAFDPRSGTYTLTLPQLRAIAGGTLKDGPHRLTIEARDAQGNVAVARVDFVLDTTRPIAALEGLGFFETTTSSVQVVYSEPVTEAAFELASYQLTITVGPDTGQVVPLESLERLGDRSLRIDLADPLSQFQLSTGGLHRHRRHSGQRVGRSHPATVVGCRADWHHQVLAV